MSLGLIRAWTALSVCFVVHWAVPRCVAAAANDAPIVVSYSVGETQLGVVREGEQFYIGNEYKFGPTSSELSGLQFTKRRFDTPGLLTIDIPAGAKVDLMIGNGGLGEPARNAATTLGFVKIASFPLLANGRQHELDTALYSQTFQQARHIDIECVGFLGVVVLAPHLTVKNNSAASAPPRGQEIRAQPSRHVEADTSIAGTTAPVKRLQSEIKALYVQEQPTGEMLGLASELILTATPGSRPGHTPVQFVSAVGSQMTAVLDDVLRDLADQSQMGGVESRVEFRRPIHAEGRRLHWCGNRHPHSIYAPGVRDR